MDAAAFQAAEAAAAAAFQAAQAGGINSDYAAEGGEKRGRSWEEDGDGGAGGHYEEDDQDTAGDGTGSAPGSAKKARRNNKPKVPIEKVHTGIGAPLSGPGKLGGQRGTLGTTSRFRGVTAAGNVAKGNRPTRWKARFCAGGTKKYLGSFKSEEEAARARCHRPPARAIDRPTTCIVRRFFPPRALFHE